MPKKMDLAAWNDAMYVAHPTPYHNKIAGIIERKRLKLIKDLTKVTEKDRVLEIGCEQGTLLASLPTGLKKVGVDISKVALKDAARLLPKADFIQADAEKPIKLPEKSFEVVICSQMLEHVANPKKVMANIKHLAKDDARVVISVPNEKFLLKMKQFLKRIGLIQWLFPGIEETTSEWHLQIFDDQKVKEMVKGEFEIIQTANAYNVYLIYLLRKI